MTSLVSKSLMPFLMMIVAVIASLGLTAPVEGQHDVDREIEAEAPSNSALARALNQSLPPGPKPAEYHALRDMSMFAAPPPKPREFAKHDLVQIIVHETSNARSRQSLETEKEYVLDGRIAHWPAFRLPDLLELQLRNSQENTPVELDLEFDKEFDGDGEYERRDDFTARLTAEVIDILPNGNLILEARTRIQIDEEIALMKVTGICRPDDVSIVNTILSNQLHDLAIEKVHEGELRNAGQKGIIAKVLDAIFAF